MTNYKFIEGPLVIPIGEKRMFTKTVPLNKRNRSAFFFYFPEQGALTTLNAVHEKKSKRSPLNSDTAACFRLLFNSVYSSNHPELHGLKY